MLSKMDDYPIHQTPEPIARPASSDRNVYDRYWFNGYQDDGAFYFGIGAALYPNLEILDCGFSIVHRRRAARLPRLAPRAEGAHRPHGRALPHRDPRADAEPARRRSTTTRPASRRDLRLDRAHRQHRGGLPALRAARRPHGRDALQPVRLLGGRDPLRRALAAHRAVARLRHQGPQRGASGRSAIRPRPAPRRSRAGGIFFIWAPLQWSDRCTHVGALRERARLALALGRHGRVPSTRARTRSPASRIRASSSWPAASTRSTSSRARGARAPRALTLIAQDRRARGDRARAAALLPHEGDRLHSTRRGATGAGRASSRSGASAGRCADLDEMAFENLHIQQVVRATQRRAAGHRRARADPLRPALALRLQGSSSTRRADVVARAAISMAATRALARLRTGVPWRRPATLSPRAASCAGAPRAARSRGSRGSRGSG